MTAHRHDTLHAGMYQATAGARATIASIEDAMTPHYAGNEVILLDLLDQALSLAGLTITVDSEHNRACIQSL